MTVEAMIERMVCENIIPKECADDAIRTLRFEMSRRSRRMSSLLAIIAERELKSRLRQYLVAGINS